MKNYIFRRIVVISVWPAGTTINQALGQELLDALEDGFEIIAATPISAQQAAGVEYILRMEIKNETQK